MKETTFIFEEILEHKIFGKYKISKETRLDGAFIINENKRHFIEIKNTTYFEKRQDKGVALFPDAVTERGQKHLVEMMKLIDGLGSSISPLQGAGI